MTFTCTMNFSNGAPPGGTMDVVVGSPDNLHIVMTISDGGGVSGTVYSTATTPETEIGTVVIYATPDASGHHGYYGDKATGNKTYF